MVLGSCANGYKYVGQVCSRQPTGTQYIHIHRDFMDEKERLLSWMGATPAVFVPYKLPAFAISLWVKLQGRDQLRVQVLDKSYLYTWMKKSDCPIDGSNLGCICSRQKTAL